MVFTLIWFILKRCNMKTITKEKYIKQSLRLIQNISYDIDDKKHRIHWILEHIKTLKQRYKH